MSEIGRSVNGRSVFAAVIGEPEAKYDVIIQASIHGRENLSSVLAMAQLERLLRLGRTGGRALPLRAYGQPGYGVETSRTRSLTEQRSAAYMSATPRWVSRI